MIGTAVLISGTAAAPSRIMTATAREACPVVVNLLVRARNRCEKVCCLPPFTGKLWNSYVELYGNLGYMVCFV